MGKRNQIKKRMSYYKPIVETEITGTLQVPNRIGLERKEGKVCLRLNDQFEFLMPGKIKVTRTWMKPGKQPFNELFYGTVQSDLNPCSSVVKT